MNDASEDVQVQLGPRSYTINIGSGTLRRVGQFLLARHRTAHAVVITDTNVEPLHGCRVAELLGEVVPRVDMVVVPAGESSKSVSSASTLWEHLLQLSADRGSIVVAAGGGVVGDLAGFIAATFARGIRLLQLPTTLLAQVDSSVGGKVGINLPEAKNIVGAFWQPLGVMIDTEVLTTLPEREYRSGLAEVVKYGVILDADFFAYLEANVQPLVRRDADVLRQAIGRCCRLKADVVEQDEREQSGLRAVLNYGHTFGHALEAGTGYDRLLHGEAVAIGMVCAARLAERLCRIAPAVTRRQQDLLTALGLPTRLVDVSCDDLLRLMSHDKKADQGRLRFVLPDRLGRVELVGGIDPQDVLAALRGPD